MTTLVTGATGFIGSAVARRVAAAGQKLRLLVRPDSDRRNLEGVPAELVEGDLERPETLAAAVWGCEYLFHLAADYRLFVPDKDRMLRTNVAGTAALLRAASAAGVRRIVYTSSVATLRVDSTGRVVDEAAEASLDDMMGAYKRSKFLAEQEVLRLVREENAPIVIAMPTAPVGPRDIKPTPTGRIIVEMARGRMPAYVDTGLNLVHVDDVADGHLRALERGRIGERYILGGENLALSRLLAIVAQHVGRSPPRLSLNANMLMPLAWCCELWSRLAGGRAPMLTCDALRMSKKKMFFSSARAERELGYTHRPAEIAIADAVDWFRANGYIP
jgi:dihydroflavonol-4-reductase